MGDIARFKAPSGEEMVMLSAADYQRLLDAAEDGTDVAAYDRAKERLASGEDELVPSDVVSRIIAGESRIKVWREYRGLTSSALAAQAGIAQGFLSQIETGKREGTVAVMQTIAEVLGVSLDDIAAAPPTDELGWQRIIGVLRAEDGLTTAEVAKRIERSIGHTGRSLHWWRQQGKVDLLPGSPMRWTLS